MQARDLMHGRLRTCCQDMLYMVSEYAVRTRCQDLLSGHAVRTRCQDMLSEYAVKTRFQDMLSGQALRRGSKANEGLVWPGAV